MSTNSLQSPNSLAVRESQYRKQIPAFAAWLVHRNSYIAAISLPLLICAALYFRMPNLDGITIQLIRDSQSPQGLLISSQLRNRQHEFYYVLLFFPIVNALFFGAPLFARSQENGTYRFSWTQSIGRLRIARVEVFSFLGITLVGAGAISAIYQILWDQPLVRAARLAINSTEDVQSISISIFPQELWNPYSMLLEPSMYIGYSVLMILIASWIGKVSKRLLVSMAVSIICLLGFTAGISKAISHSMLINPHTVRTDDPLNLLPDNITQQKWINAGYMPKNPSDPFVNFPVRDGWLTSNGDVIQIPTKTFIKSVNADGSITFLSGTEYKNKIKEINMPYVLQWRAPEDHKTWIIAWSLALAASAIFMLSMIRLAFAKRFFPSKFGNPRM